MNKASPKPKVGDKVKILPGGGTTTARNHVGKILTVTLVFPWCISTNAPNCGGVWPDEFIIVSTVTKEQKQHLLDLIKSI